MLKVNEQNLQGVASMLSAMCDIKAEEEEYSPKLDERALRVEINDIERLMRVLTFNGRYISIIRFSRN